VLQIEVSEGRVTMTRPQSRTEYPTDNKIPVRLSARLDQALLAYAAAASSAGVAVLALACPADARIIYTRANEQIFPNKLFPLDLNHDTKKDFTFVDSHGSTSFGGGLGVLTIFPNQSANEIWGYKTSRGFFRQAAALAAGVQVGPKGKFSPGEMIMLTTSVSGGDHKGPSTSSRCIGLWKNATNRYLGLKFVINGKPHYGWARLNVFCSNVEVLGKLTGYAYETVPNKAIITGKTKDDAESSANVYGENLSPSLSAPTLGRLARGASGLSTSRNGQEPALPFSGNK
jgi:hypothetical protein